MAKDKEHTPEFPGKTDRMMNKRLQLELNNKVIDNKTAGLVM